MTNKDVQEVLGREPTSREDVGSMVIETYNLSRIRC